MAHDTTHPVAMDPLNLPLIAGDDYLVAMGRRSADVETRRAFTQWAMRCAPAGGHIYDFGCGPGIDARQYAMAGYTVSAYDIDPRMRGTLSRLCREQLDSGQVTLDAASSYAEFLAERVPPRRRAHLVTANFAPLNLVEDPVALFAKFDALLGEEGRVLASVLNPWCITDARYPWWWRNLPALAARGHYVVGAGRVHRRSPGWFARAARPQFRLAEVLPGTARPGWRKAITQYLFLRFERA